MIRAVLLDLDGTLIDTWRLYLETYRRVLAEMGERPWSAHEVAALRPTGELRFFDRVLGPERRPEVQARFLANYGVLHDAHCEGFYPGVPEMLARLAQASLVLGIVTGKSLGAWRITSRRLPLEVFRTVVTDDDVAQPKPAPDGLLLALRRLHVAPSEAVYVGDSVADMQAARAAGMVGVAVLWPKSAEERDAFRAEVEGMGARIAETPEDLMALLNGNE